MELIGKGAEAEIFVEGGNIIKKRVKKQYRLEAIDNALRKSRTKREAKILESMPKEVPHPKLLRQNFTDMTLEMELIKGEKVRDMIEKNPEMCTSIGKKIAIMHNSGIIHGDLTTSNMILKGKEVYFIDFGLSFFSKKNEDKAVDLHLLKQAMESKHHAIFKKAFAHVMEGYKSKAKNYTEIKERFDIVELRGRNKAKF